MEKKFGTWISIKEQLPPMNESVLATEGTDLYAAMRLGYEGGRWRWVTGSWMSNVKNSDSYQADDRVKIFYWMPLPELPKRSEA